MKLFKRGLLTLGLILSVFGVLFMISHWPFQKLIFLAGFLFLYTYCLIFFFQRIRRHTSRILLAGDISGLIATTLYFIGISINLFEFQYSIIFSWLFVFSLIVFTSLLLVIVVKRDENRRFRITWLVISTLLLIIVAYFTVLDTVEEIQGAYTELNIGLAETLENKKTEIDDLVADLDSTHPNFNTVAIAIQKMDSLNYQILNLKRSFKETSANPYEAVTDSLYMDKLPAILQLKLGMNNFREYLLFEVDDIRIQNIIQDALNTDKDENNIIWEEPHFKHLPVEGVVTILSGIQVNINSASSDAIKYLIEIDYKD